MQRRASAPNIAQARRPNQPSLITNSRGCAVTISHRKGDFANYSAGAPVEAHFTVSFAGHCRHHAGAEAFMGRRGDGRAASFGPAYDKASIC